MARVMVALSGGIDSAVSAFLLKDGGHQVTAVHMLTGLFERRSGDSSHQASRIARFLNIPLEICDLSAPFRRIVVEYFINSYLKGRTPNPCVVCNPSIKFGYMLRHSVANGNDYLATGHYVRSIWDKQSARYLLYKGKDKTKDQSYFLHRLDQEQLSKTIFPLGTYEKERVKDIAGTLGISSLITDESQEFCFMGVKNYKELVESSSNVSPGDLVDLKGKVLKQHKGLHRYTIGQRRGLNLPSSEPYYVVDIDPQNNRVMVGRKKDLFAAEMIVEDVNWIKSNPGQSFRASTRIRFRHREVSSFIESVGDARVRVLFDDEVRAITPGQAAVFYDEDLVIGGGWIKNVVRTGVDIRE